MSVAPARPKGLGSTIPAEGSVIHPDADTAVLAMASRFEAAARISPPLLREPYYDIAGHRLRSRIVGAALTRSVHHPWAHLSVEDGASSPAELRIDLWDETETGVAHDARADVVGPSPRFPFQMSADTRLVGHRLAQTLTWLDRRSGRVVGCVGDRSSLSSYERGRLLETPVLFWLRDRGVQLVHAALVSRQDDGVLLVGRSGSGKSTCALACLQAGFDFLGDDKVALQRDVGDTYSGWSLTGSAHLEPDHLARFPEFQPHALPGSASGEDKSVVLLSRVRPKQLRVRATIRALAIVCVASDEPRGVHRARRSEALLATALSTVLQLPIEPTRAMRTLADLVTRAPAYSLGVGRDLRRIPQQVTAILEDARRLQPS